VIQGITAFNVLAEVSFVQNEYEEAQQWGQIARQCFEDLHEPWTLANHDFDVDLLRHCPERLCRGAKSSECLLCSFLRRAGWPWQIPAC